MISYDLVDSDHIDYMEYCRLQKEAFSDILTKAKVSNYFITPEYYKWKYNSPAGKAKIVLVREGDRIIASNAMFPLEINFLDKKLIGWESCDTATLPEARGKGYFQDCINILKKKLKPDEIFFGFPNRNSINGFVKSGWRNWGIVTTWINPKSLFLKESREIIEIKRFGDEQDLFLTEYTRLYDCMISRSVAYMNWRYVENPVNEYSVFSFIKDGKQFGSGVLRTANVLNRFVVIVMELLAISSDVENKILRHFAWWTKMRGSSICILLDRGLSFPSGLRAGFIPVWHRFLPKKQLLMGYASSGELMERIATGNWRVQTGDWDSF